MAEARIVVEAILVAEASIVVEALEAPIVVEALEVAEACPNNNELMADGPESCQPTPPGICYLPAMTSPFHETVLA